MRRRPIAYLLIVLVLQPWLSCAHAHAEVSEHDPSGKVRAPHFHLRFLPGFWRVASPVRYAGHAPVLMSGATARDHDADALYIPMSILLGWDKGHEPAAPVQPADLAMNASPSTVHIPLEPSTLRPVVGRVGSTCRPDDLRNLVLLV